MPDPTVLTSQEIGTLGFFLSLISLLGSFFYVQLSNWLRDLIAAETVYEGNKVQGEPVEVAAIRQLKYSIKGLYNRVPLMTSTAITLFICLIAGIIFSILRHALGTDPLAQKLGLALLGFLVIYGVLTSYILLRGYRIGRKISNAVKPPRPA